MILYYIALSLLLLFFVVAVIGYLAMRMWNMGFWNATGFLATIAAIVLEITGQHSRLSLMLLAIVIFAILVLDFLQVGQVAWQGKQHPENNVKAWQKLLRRHRVYVCCKSEDFLDPQASSERESEIEKIQAFQLWQRGNRALLEGRYEEAIQQYDLSIKWFPTAAAYVNQAAAYLILNDFDAALQAAEKAVHLDQKKVEAWANLGLAHEGKGKHTPALSSFQKALALNESEIGILVLVANELRHLGKIEEALQTYDRALSLDSRHPEALRNKALALGMKGEHYQALELLNQALKVEPQNADSHFHLANTLNKLNRNEEAAAAYRKSLKLRPDFPEAWNNLGIAYTKLDRLKEAVQSYQKAIELNEKYFEAWLNLALAAENRNDYRLARNSFQRFLELAPASLERHRKLAEKHLAELLQRTSPDESDSSSNGGKQQKSKEEQAENEGMAS